MGDKAQKEVEKKLADLDKKVNQAAEELKEALAEKRKEAIAAIDKRIEEMKEAMKGAISKLAGLLVDALLKLFKWALSKIGVSYESLKDIVSKGIKVVTSLVTSPGSFISNMISAVSGGISKFVDNFLTHLKNGFFEWLTGTVSGAGITLPDTWDLKGIFFFIGQVVGLGWDNLKEKLGIVVGKEKDSTGRRINRQRRRRS
ncbi:MAG: hypothetical protein IPJ43_02570 [Saprospiraceae bacterium]|nr:hypothetical protein [Saprospiraceae bacterium]